MITHQVRNAHTCRSASFDRLRHMRMGMGGGEGDEQAGQLPEELMAQLFLGMVNEGPEVMAAAIGAIREAAQAGRRAQGEPDDPNANEHPAVGNPDTPTAAPAVAIGPGQSVPSPTDPLGLIGTWAEPLTNDSHEEDEWSDENSGGQEDDGGEINEEEESVDDPDDLIYPDGLVADSMVPLSLVSRPFLHACRVGESLLFEQSSTSFSALY